MNDPVEIATRVLSIFRDGGAFTADGHVVRATQGHMVDAGYVLDLAKISIADVLARDDPDRLRGPWVPGPWGSEATARCVERVCIAARRDRLAFDAMTALYLDQVSRQQAMPAPLRACGDAVESGELSRPGQRGKYAGGLFERDLAICAAMKVLVDRGLTPTRHYSTDEDPSRFACDAVAAAARALRLRPNSARRVADTWGRTMKFRALSERVAFLAHHALSRISDAKV